MRTIVLLAALGLLSAKAAEPLTCAVTVIFPASSPTSLHIQQPNPECKAHDVAMALKVAAGLFEQAPPPNQAR